MSVEMTVVATEMNVEAVPAHESLAPPRPESMNWICSQCGASISWLPPKVRHLHPSKIRCLDCQKKAQAAKAPAEVPPVPQPAQPVESSVSPAPAPDAPKQTAPQRPPRNHQDRRPPQTYRPHLTMQMVELEAYRLGIQKDQVDALLAALRNRLSGTPSSDK